MEYQTYKDYCKVKLKDEVCKRMCEYLGIKGLLESMDAKQVKNLKEPKN